MIYSRNVNGPLALFSPLSRAVCAVKAGLYRRGWKKARRAPLPVVSVGNLAFGGSGKTPLAMEILDWLLRRGIKPALVTRGYKGCWEESGGVLSDGASLLGGWREGGDEPFMVARRLPEAGVFVGRHRYRSCVLARERGFDVAVLDDGFQHLKLARGLDIVLAGRRTGPLREGPRALRRADLVLLDGAAGSAGKAPWEDDVPNGRLFEYRVRPAAVIDAGTGRSVPAETLRGMTAVAFCGIARPERFFALIESLGVVIAEKLVFPDHYDYPPWGLERVGDACRRHWPAAVLTTEKDIGKVETAVPRLAPLPVLVVRIGLDLPAGFYERLASWTAGLRGGDA